MTFLTCKQTHGKGTRKQRNTRDYLSKGTRLTENNTLTNTLSISISVIPWNDDDHHYVYDDDIDVYDDEADEDETDVSIREMFPNVVYFNIYYLIYENCTI